MIEPEGVSLGTAGQVGVALTTIDIVVSFAAFDAIVAGTRKDRVIALDAIDGFIAAIREDLVFASQSPECFVGEYEPV